MTFRLQATDKDVTVVEEVIQFDARWPIRSMMERTFRKQHEQLFKNMEAQ